MTSHASRKISAPGEVFEFYIIRDRLNYKITQKGVIFYKHLIYSRRILLKYSTVGIICDFIDA